jgi:LCP family protein required for cell wall assembly
MSQEEHIHRRVSKKVVWGNVIYILFLGFCLFAGAIAGWLNKSEVFREIVSQTVRPSPPQKIFKNSIDGGNSITVLILGCDKELYYKGAQVLMEHARSDMMMVARLDFNRKLVGAVSIPRDTLCDLPGYKTDKINSFNKTGGPELAKAAVEHILPDVKIDRVVTLNFDAFIEVIDMLGGVDVYVPKDMKYTDQAADLYIDLKKGKQHLSGYEAMGFVRWRKNDNGRGSDSDFERQKRQKDLMLAVKEKLITNWQQGVNILDKTTEISGNTFNNREVAALMLFMRELGGSEKIRMGQIPVIEIPGTYDLEVDQNKLPSVLSQFLDLQGESTLKSEEDS